MTMKSVLLPAVFLLLTSTVLSLLLIKEPTRDQTKEGSSQQVIDEVFVVFMNHLDVGYSDSESSTAFINVVLNSYFHDFFPRAIALSRELRERGYKERFVYNTHPWLVHLYMNCPQNLTLAGVKLQCPNAEERSNFSKAVQLGDITWHAGPMNMQPENMDQLLFELSLNISSILDNQFNITRKYRAYSSRDVPGMTAAVIPTLVKKGVASIVEVSNSGSSPPDIPSLAVWKFQGKEVIYMGHPGITTNSPGSNSVHPGIVSRGNCITSPGFNKALCIACRGQNNGPPMTIKEVLANYEAMQKLFPGASIKASTFDAFTEAVQPIKTKLPVITKEMGDTWIFGISSDPRKMAEYRAVSQTIMQCINDGNCKADDPRIQESVVYLIKPAEHTWGLPGVYDTINWSNAAFDRVKTSVKYTNCVKAWLEQRRFVDLAVTALGDHPVVKDVKKSLSDLTPTPPDLRGFYEVNITQKYDYMDGMEFQFAKDGTLYHLYDPWNQWVEIKDVTTMLYYMDGMTFQFAKDGSLYHLYDPVNKMTWANGNRFGGLFYRTYDEADFTEASREYSYLWNFFSKNNLTRNAHPESKLWSTKLDKVYRWEGNDFVLYAKIILEDPEAYTKYGAPKEIWLLYIYRMATSEEPAGFDVTLTWFDKPPTRLPESLMFFFTPLPPPPSTNSNLGYQWRVSKLGQMVDPAHVMLNGSQYQHATDKGVYYTDEDGNGIEFLTQDVPAVTMGTIAHSPTPFPSPLQPIEQGQILSASFNLFNNVWDTNYILWYPYIQQDKDFMARFKINFRNNGGGSK